MQQQGYSTQGQSNRTRGEYYGGGQFDERMQSSGWDEDRSDWDYEGGPERYSTSGYGETGQQNWRQNQGQQQGRQWGSQQQGGQYGSQREFGQGGASSDYYSGRQGYRSQGAFGSEYNTYGRNQGYGEGYGLSRSQQSRGQGGSQSQFGGRGDYDSSSRYGGESAGFGGRGTTGSYTDQGEMSGYGGRELSTQQYGSSSSGRYGTSPGQYGYGGYGAGSSTGTSGYRGVGPKNYTRSDERITEELNERLTDDDDLDAGDITVRVSGGKVTLEGTVDQRWMKHRAEDIADSCSGVKEVDNRIQVSARSSSLGQTSGSSLGSSSTSRTGTTGSTGTTTTGTTGTTGSSGTTPH
jgi:osmotically-inducible protein OsmY